SEDWTFLARRSMSLTTAAAAISTPRLRSIGFIPAATSLRPSLMIEAVSTVAVVVPSPALSLVFEATWRTICAPMFSNLSSSSISLATVTPSLVMRGAPYDLSRTTLRPFGPSVTFTALLRTSTPRSILSRASEENLTSFADMIFNSLLQDKAEAPLSGLRSTGIISAGLEVIDAFRRFEDVGAGVEGDQQAGDGSFGDFAQEGLQLGIGLFDRVHVGAVRRQISQFGSGRLYELLDPRSLVARQIVHDDDVAFREGGDETFFHPLLERGRVDRPVEGLLRHEAAKAQAGDERNRLVMAVRDGGAQPSAAPTASAFARHIRRSPGLVDEHEASRIEIE